jgi:hypothetical protein
MVTTMVVLVAGVWVMDLLFPAYDPGPHRLYSGNPFAHIGHMISYGSHLTSRAGAPGISSSPWQWLLDQKPITYARAAVTTTSNLRVVSQRAILFFRGEINPFIILAAIPALFSAAGLLWRRRREPEGIAPGKGITTCTAAYDEVPLVAVAWFIGTFGPFVIQADVLHRVTYLFYILIVMPGIYLALAAFLARCGLAVIAGSAIVLAFGFVHQYPIRTFSGH